MPNSPIICALDMMDINRAIELTKEVSGRVAMVKLGLEFFSAYGISGVHQVANLGVPIFLDLKLHDIPNTVAMAIGAIKTLDIAMLTIHVSGGRNMIQASVDVLSDSKILPVGVTVLTSIDDADFEDFGIHGPVGSHVMRLVDLAVDAGLQAVVCSAHEVSTIRKRHPELKLVVPGVRLNVDVNDHKRVKTPIEALSDGANYLVIGRPITQSPNPYAAIDEILHSIKGHK
ncbi:MAG: orotidine-5'-phosphate decarboxylase [Anaplasma sp.]